MIELFLLFIRCSQASSAARALGKSRSTVILRTALTWFAVEVGILIVIGIPLVAASEFWFPLTDEQGEVALLLFAYPFALLAANGATVRQIRHDRERARAFTAAA